LKSLRSSKRLTHPHTLCDIDENNLVGEIPSEIGFFRTMEEISFYSNQIRGIFPESMSQLTDLTVLDAESNEMSGDPFEVLFQLGTLRRLRLSENMFSGRLGRSSVRNFDKLRELWIGENLFRGELPTTIGNMAELGMYA